MEDDNRSDAPSSGSDFYNDAPTDAPSAEPSAAPARSVTSPGLTLKNAPAVVSQDAPQIHCHAAMLGADGDGESSDEMDLSDSDASRSPTPKPGRGVRTLPDRPQQLRGGTESPGHAGAKRKLSEDPLDALEQSLADNSKKPRLLQPPSSDLPPKCSFAGRLPVQLWQQVFLRLSPAMLSRCLRVSKTFNRYLINTRAEPMATKKDSKKIRVLDSDTIWAEARKAYFPNMPRPLMHCTELKMLQLMGGKTCQFCDRALVSAPATTPFNAGPGPDAVRVIWPFGIRTCGGCWEQRSIKDTELMVSSANTLRFGLPHAFRTLDLHFVPEIQRQLPGGIPQHFHVAKVYYQRDVDDIKAEFEEVKGFGEGAADEWRKGLNTKGKERMADAARWEKWESQMRFGIDLARVLREYDLPSFPRHVEAMKSKPAGVSPTTHNPPLTANGPHALPPPVYAFPPDFIPTSGTSTAQSHSAFRPLRNAHDIEEARAARKAEIERRCLELEPPLEPKVLPFMESFNAAMQITTPMNDSHWEMLKPRLLLQREAAELREHQKAEQLAALQAAIPSADDSFLKPAKEVYDQKYEDAQEPLRRRLGEYAEEYIYSHWHNGQGLERDGAPLLAIETIQYVRKRYWQDKQAGTLPVHDQAARESSKQGSPAPVPFLSLDNMKWVYDNKIRTLTDAHRRELFICAGCAGCNEDRKPKLFAFEGLIQHYGAKHTTAFSKGNIVVHWQTAVWPDDPPFHTNPSQWIKPDRKVAEYKSHARSRNTPLQRTARDGAYVPPSPNVLLSDNPLFSGGAQRSPTGSSHFPGPPHGVPPMPWNPHQNNPLAAQSAQQPAHMSYPARLHKFASDAREIWDILESTPAMPECIRMRTVLHHVIVRFLERFKQKPSLDLLTDALATNESMRPLKNANGLACKICVAAQDDGSADYQSYYARIRNVKLYNASSLVTHFKLAHQQGAMSHIDWTKHMIEPPETQLVSELVRTPGMDDEKLALVAQAFPTAFPLPLPKIGMVKEEVTDIGSDSGLYGRLFDRLNNGPQKPGKKRRHQTNGIGRRDASDHAFPEPTEDEYDPRRPMYTQEQSADPARFDTDLLRKPSPPAGLTSETLAALDSLDSANVRQQGAVPDDNDRSPSVGRAEPAANGAANCDATSDKTPDISAILATLTGKLSAQTATPPATVDNRAGSAPRFPPAQALHAAPSSSAIYSSCSRRYSGRQDVSYCATTVPSPRLDQTDFKAALARNSIHFEQNQQLRAPTQAPYSTASRTPRSPPRYHYVDEGSQQHYPQPLQPAYNPPAVQYIPMQPEHGQQAPVQYHHEHRSAPKPIYVDEYGRPVELIPIDSGPAPIQYAPHPYDQQQYHYAQQQQPAYPSQQPPVYQHAYGLPMYYGQAPQPRFD